MKAAYLVTAFLMLPVAHAEPAVPTPPTQDMSYSPCRIAQKATRSLVGSECQPGEVISAIEKMSPLTLRCATLELRCESPTRFLSSDSSSAAKAETAPQANSQTQGMVPAPPAAAPASAAADPAPSTEKSIELLPPPPDLDTKTRD